MRIDPRNNEKDYKDEGKHSKWVSNKNFVHDLEVYHPQSVAYREYWREMKKRCMEGYWFEGKWMPGPLYFYINFCKIRLSENDRAKAKIVARPFLRDLEWEKAYVFMEARGFSGFEGDDEYTCLQEVQNLNLLSPEDRTFLLSTLPAQAFDKKGQLKKYVRARDYLRTIHSVNLGKPLFHNPAYNVIDIECRGSGKSYWASGGMVLPTFLFDGGYDYEDLLQKRKNKIEVTTDVLVGAIDGKYSKELLDKVALAMNNLPGSQTIGKLTYPCPLAKQWMGSWYSGKNHIESAYEVKVGGQWVKKGTGSKIHHRTFKDDAEAGNGIRTSLGVIEEVGFFNILKEALAQMKDTTYNGSFKYGSIYMFGTGGNMEGGKSEAAMEVFNSPKEYDCLVFQDVWEDTGDIGFFVPYELGLNEFKDSEGRTNMTQATKKVDKIRNDLQAGKSKLKLYKEMQNNPRVPSEAFLIKGANIFPTAELKDHMNWLLSNKQDAFVSGQCGELVWKPGSTLDLYWKPDLTGKLNPCGYKMKPGEDTQGCIQIWEHPLKIEGQVPYGLYLAGTDPYDQDRAENTASLGSTFIYKTFYTADGIYEWPVAEYTARPGTAEEHHETLRKLLLYYNARDLYENERNTLKMHFSHKNSLYLLNKTPTILKATKGSTVDRSYGIHMTDTIKSELEIYTRDWLQTETGDGRLNLHKIYSVPLLKELIYYNKEGNFDRVIAFMLTILNRLQFLNHKVEEAVADKGMDPFLQRALSGKIFR
jgi:hypothetical protein